METHKVPSAGDLRALNNDVFPENERTQELDTSPLAATQLPDYSDDNNPLKTAANETKGTESK